MKLFSHECVNVRQLPNIRLRVNVRSWVGVPGNALLLRCAKSPFQVPIVVPFAATQKIMVSCPDHCSFTASTHLTLFSQTKHIPFLL